MSRRNGFNSTYHSMSSISSPTYTYSPKTVYRDGQKPLKFQGHELVCVSSKDYNSTAWTEYTLYLSQRKNIVLKATRYSLWEGERTRHQGHYFKTPSELVAFLESAEFGLSPLADELLTRACEVLPGLTEAYSEEV